MIAAAAAMAVASVGVFGGIGSVGAAPPMPLPDAELVCPGHEPVTSRAWVGFGVATLWVLEGDLSGHYAVLDEAHYAYEGLLEDVPATWEEGFPLGPKTFGKKVAFEGSELACSFLSRWDAPGEEDDMTIAGPITIAELPARR